MTELEKQMLQSANKKYHKGVLGRLFPKYKQLTNTALLDIEELEIKKIQLDSLMELKSLENLKSLFFYNCTFGKKIAEETVVLEQVEELDFEGVWLEDLSVLKYFPNVTKLTFWEYGEKQTIHMKGIEYAPGIKRFYAVNTLFDELERMAVCKNMRWLELDNFLPEVNGKMKADYTFLNAFPQLLHIGLMTGDVEDVSFLEQNQKLNEILLSQNTGVKNVERLASLKELKKLDLDDCKISKEEKKQYIKIFSYVEKLSIEN